MFTGLVQTLGRVTALVATGGDKRLHVAVAEAFAATVTPGDSIAVNGVCLTVTANADHSLVFDLSAETLACTALSRLETDSPVNLEPSLRVGDKLGGHIVSGHVDTTVTVDSIQAENRAHRLTLSFAPRWAGLLAPKGSVALDGVSLTINTVTEAYQFSVAIIPHTWNNTVIGSYEPGMVVNMEVDMLARYVARLRQVETMTGADNGEGLAYDTLYRL